MTLPTDSFNEAAILAEARAAAGLVDFGEEGFREPLGVLLSSYAAADLHELGVRLLRSSVIFSLVSRLRAQYWFQEFPEISDEVIEAPLVVVGMMRSGTTLLQRLLASDGRHYSALGWEVRAPAPAPDAWPTEPDPRIAEAEAQSEQAQRFAPDLFAIHPSHAHQAEEEIILLANAFLSHVPEASCDVPAYRSWLDDQDFTPAYEYLYRMLQLLQWQKKCRGEVRGRWILKTPAHLGYLDVLFKIFPDAHVIHMHRRPADVIASGASLNATLWRMHARDVDPRRVGRQWLERMVWANERALEARESLVGKRRCFSDIWFRDALADPLGEIGKIYDTIGLDFEEAARDAMKDWLGQNTREKFGAHRYALEDFGLSEEEVGAKFSTYLARFPEE